MSMDTNQYKKKSGVPVGIIVGFSMLFTPLFFIGIILIVWSIIIMVKKNQNNMVESGVFKEAMTNTNITKQSRPMQFQGDEIKRHTRTHEPIEKMSKEDRDNYQKYHSIKNSYEQTVVPIKLKRNETNMCQVCRNVSTKNVPYCEVCGELFGDGLKCTFCKTKNELNAEYCKNCGVRFKK